MSYLSKKNIADIYPLSPMQQGMLFHTLYDPSASTFHEQFSCRIDGDLDIRKLETAWNHIIDQSPTFRTVYNWNDAAQPIQIVLKKRPVRLVYHDYKAYRDAAGREKLDEFLGNDLEKPFDMAKGPLIRLNIFEMADKKYYFLWSYHHIILDGWCISLIMTDLMTAYSALLNSEPLPDFRRPPYKNYISWLSRQDKEKAGEFWRGYLEGFDTPTSLPWDRPGDGGLETKERDFHLPKALTERLEDFARQQRTTLSTVVQSLWGILLARYSGRDDVVFGITVSGRPPRLARADETIGLFINSLPVRTFIDPEGSYLDFLDGFKENTANIMAYDYSFLPDIKACSDVSVEDNLFESIVVFENYPLDAHGFDMGLGMNIHDVVIREKTNSDITLGCIPGEELTFRAIYNSLLFKEKTIEMMLDHLFNIINEVLDHPEKPVCGIELLSPEEKHKIMVTFNDTDMDFPDRPIHELFEEQAAGVPGNMAIKYMDRQMTYAELNQKANQLARLMQQNGVKAGSIVAIMTGRCPEMIIGILGILKAGGAYVPVDPDYPEDRIAYLLEDSGSTLLLTLSRFRESTHTDKKLIFLDQEETFQGDDTNLDVVTLPTDLAYVIYTSGSTGRPKGAQIMHRNLVNLCCWHNHELGVDETDRGSMFAGVSFDASIYEIWPHLIVGSCLYPLEHVLNEMSAQDMAEWLRKNRITRCYIPTKLAEVVMDMDLSDLCLKTMHTGGDRLSFIPRKHPFHVINNYGPAEVTVVTVAADVKAWDNAKGNPPIGKPVSNVKLYILDEQMRPVPIGVIGELYIGGAAVGRGYLNDPEKTRSVFIPNPFSDNDELLYRTGDFVRWMPDGNVDYIGRMDFQVEIRGYRVEIGEIEVVLSVYEGVRECVIIDKTDDNGRTRLVGFYVADDSFDEIVCYDYLKKQLPSYMIPSRLIKLDRLPTTPNDKVDRRALVDMVDAYMTPRAEYVAPATEVETLLADIWQNVLSVEKVGVHDNFFDLGGDSIISLQVVGKLKKHGYMLRPRDIFEHHTIAELALVAREFVPISAEQGPVEGTAPLTPVQKWFFDLGLENENHFNQALMFRSSVPIDENALRESLAAVMDHHDVLRAGFTREKQVFSPSGRSGHFTAKQVSGEDQLIKEVTALQSSFDIESGPVFGVGLYHMGDTDYLVLAGHHLAVDGVSWRIILEDLFSGYAYASNGNPIEFPEKTTSFKAWAAKLEAYASTPGVIAESAYWKRVLENADAPVSIDHDLGPNDMASTDAVMFELGREETGNLLKGAHKAYNTDVNDLLITALVRAFAEISENDRVVFNLEGHGREDVMDGVDISRTVGWFTTVFPVALDADAGDSLSDQVKYVKETLHTIPDNGMNYGILKYTGGLDDPVRADISFNYLGQVVFDELSGMLKVDRMNVPGTIDGRNIRKHLIDVVCVKAGDTMTVSFAYSRNKHRKETIEDLANRFKESLSQVIAHCMDPDSFDITPSDFALADLSNEDLDSIYE